MINITLPDGSRKSFETIPTVQDVAASIGAGLARAALAGKVDGDLVDTSRVIDHDARLEIVTEKSPEALEIIRHSTAHLLAQAVQRLFPKAQVTIGPVIENGFYYDFAFERQFTTEDLALIEGEMKKIAAEALPVSRSVMARDEAVRYFRAKGEEYKAQIIEGIPANEELSLYTQGEFTDLCRGPHVPNTNRLKTFKLMKVAGAYWRGDSDNEMLSRIYGTAWLNDKDLAAYLNMLEEAEKRDHRKIGKALDLFHQQEESPGMVFWHPKGWTIWQQVEQYMRRVYRRSGYQEVRCPMVLDVSMWKKSGHWDNYAENMFFTESEKRTYALKPMNCPGHVQIFNTGLAQLPRAADPLRRIRRLPPQRAVGRPARDHARACVHPGRRTHLLHRGTDRVGGHRVSPSGHAGLRGFRLQRHSDQARAAPGQAHRLGRVLGPHRGRAAPCAACRRRRMGGTAGRGRVLRAEDRISPQGLDWPGVAGRHDAGRFHDARAPGRRICRRTQPAPASGRCCTGPSSARSSASSAS